jgi:hypothetical protein
MTVALRVELWTATARNGSATKSERFAFWFWGTNNIGCRD